MKSVLAIVCAGILVGGVCVAQDAKPAEAEPKKDAKSESLFTLLTGMKMEKEKKKSESEVSIPVDTSGTRGFEITSRALSPVWPSTEVTPLMMA